MFEVFKKKGKENKHIRESLFECQRGFVSSLVAAKWKDRISKLVLFYPALCIPDDARAGKMMFAKFDPQNSMQSL